MAHIGVVASMMALGYLKAVLRDTETDIGDGLLLRGRRKSVSVCLLGSGHVTGVLSLADGVGLADPRG